MQEAIFEAAIKLFSEQGFDQTTMEEIAKAAGVSRRSMFRYFPTKNDLLARSVVNYEHILINAIEACDEGASPVSLIRAGVFAGADHNFVSRSYARMRGSSSRRAVQRQRYRFRPHHP